jgi:hypothetical protein
MQAVREVLGGSAMQRVGEAPQPARKPEAVTSAAEIAQARL